VPLRRTGDLRGALDALEESYTVAKQYAVVPASFAACDAIATILLDRDDVCGAKLWHDRALELIVHTHVQGDHQRVSHLAAAIALAEGRADDAAAILAIVPNNVLADPFLRRRADAEATWVRIQIGRGHSLEHDSLLEDLEQLHKAGRGLGGHDFCAYSLFLGLCARQETTKAERLLAEYVRQFRRETGPLPAEYNGAMNWISPPTSRLPGSGYQD
jgi:hypothetical protein